MIPSPEQFDELIASYRPLSPEGERPIPAQAPSQYGPERERCLSQALAWLSRAYLLQGRNSSADPQFQDGLQGREKQC